MGADNSDTLRRFPVQPLDWTLLLSTTACGSRSGSSGCCSATTNARKAEPRVLALGQYCPSCCRASRGAACAPGVPRQSSMQCLWGGAPLQAASPVSGALQHAATKSGEYSRGRMERGHGAIHGGMPHRSWGGVQALGAETGATSPIFSEPHHWAAVVATTAVVRTAAAASTAGLQVPR